MKTTFLLFVALSSAAAAFGQKLPYTADGNLAVPDYSKWVFLSSGLGMAYSDRVNPNPPFTNVFAEPTAYDEYMKNGVWPDGTMLVVERRASASGVSINKSGHIQTGAALGAELEVKDKSRGGWTFYDVPQGSKIAKFMARSESCYSCHAEHAAVDNTFVQFYPNLIEIAKQKGTYKDR